MKKYNVAVIGCGKAGVGNLFDKSLPFTYSFVGAVLKNPATQLVALVDIDKKKCINTIARLVKERYVVKGLRGYESLASAIISSKKEGQPIDIVCCAVGPGMNVEVIAQAKEFGIKGIYCEKPLALSLPVADELVRREKLNGVKIQVNYLRNFESFHVSILNFIRKGGIGDVLIARVLYKGGVLAVAPHNIALLNLLFGRPVAVSGIFSPLLNTRELADPNIDGVITYRFGNRLVNASIMATGRGDLKNNTYIFELEFTGTKGRIAILENGIRLRYEAMEPSKVFGKSEYMPYATERIPMALKASPTDGKIEYMLDGLQDLIDAIENDRPTQCSAKVARDAEEVAHALAIAAERGETLKLPLESPDNKHGFRNSRSGIDLLRKEAGIKPKK